MLIHKPSGLKFHTKPWKHQIAALQYLWPRSHGALYTDMGSGKTKVFIDLVVNKQFRVTVVVATTKICKRKTWETEISKHAPNNGISIINLINIPSKKRPTTLREVLTARNFSQIVVVVNYESIWREPFKTFLLKLKLDCVICDESHKIKTPGSKCSRMLQLLGRRTPNRFLMTGTPLGQSPLDIYAQYRFLDPSIFGTNFSDFKHRYSNWVIAQGGFEVLDKKNPYKNLDELHEKMFSCAFLSEVEDTLPPYQDIAIEFELSQEAQKYYKELRKEGCLEIEQGMLQTGNVLAVITREQQLASGYLPLEDENGRKKLVELDNSRQEALKELLEDIPEYEPVVIFAKFKKDIQNIREVCTQLGRGSSELSGQRDTTQDWVNGDTVVLVVQIAAGAEGLNELVKARYCVYYTLHHSLTLWKQSRKRIRRPGQTRPVIYYTLVAKLKKGKTIDEKIRESLENNQEIIDVVLNTREW